MADTNPLPESPPQRDPRLCSHEGKDGKGCKAYARHDGSGLCAGHGASPEDLERASVKSAEVRRARVEARPRSVKEALAKRFEARADAAAALLDADIDRQDSGSVRAWHDLVYGKPTQTVVTDDTSKQAGEYTLAELEAMRETLLRGDNVVPISRPG